MSRGPATLPEIVRLLGGYRLPFGRELAMQNAVDQVLAIAGIPFERELDLGAGVGRIDFFLPGPNIGLELKVKGSPAEVTAQLMRYAACPQINALALVSGRIRLGILPNSLAGKPLEVVGTWRSGL